MSWTTDSLQTYRRHRHDVMNGLQVVRGYIQLNRPSDAIDAVDRLAAWLKSLTSIQQLVGAYGGWLSVASETPQVIVDYVSDAVEYTHNHDTQLTAVWHWLDGQCARAGVKVMVVRVLLRAGSTEANGVPAWVAVRILGTPAIEDWWATIGRDECPFAFLALDDGLNQR